MKEGKMTLPILPVTMPSDLAGKTNGKLPASMLREVGPSGRLHHLAARAFKAMSAAAAVEGFHLTYTYGGTFRSYDAQRSLFLSRYSTRRTNRHSKVWNGVRYWNHTGAMAAVPGTSNHGWGLAIDLALDHDLSDGVGPNDAQYIGPALDWLKANAWRYGFSWELQSEPWHVRYVKGDAVPAAVFDFEKNGEPAPPVFPTLRVGSTGEHVRYLQRVLNVSGHGTAVDGQFGPQTDRHVKSFQKCVGITVDGIVGPQTWEQVRNVGDGMGVARP